MIPKADACAIGTRTAAMLTSGFALLMEASHLPDVHPIDVIGGKHCHEIGLMPLDEVEIPVDGVCRAFERPGCAIGLREHHADGGLAARRPGAHAVRICSMSDCGLYCANT